MDKPPIPGIPIEEAKDIIKEIKDNGLIDDRMLQLTSYPKCFVGEDVVKHLIVSGRAKDADQAIVLGQSLLDHRLVHHVTDDHTFKNEYLFYRLYSDEPDEIQKEAALFEERVAKAKLAGYLKLLSLIHI